MEYMQEQLMPKSIECIAVYPTLAVPSVDEACNWYVERLGFTHRFMLGEPPTHGAVLLDKACVHFWLGPPQRNENWLYFDITNVDAMHALATSNDVEITKAPQDYPWGMREFSGLDLNGYNIRFGQNLGR